MRSSVKTTGIALSRDIRNTFRIWRRNPWSTLAAYLALTIGIAATTTIFSVLSSLLLSPLPVADSNHVVRVAGIDVTGHAITMTMPNALDLKQGLRSVGQFAIYRLAVGNLAERSRPAMVHVLEIDADLFKVMGIQLANGHPFGEAANNPGANCEAVISWPLWQSQFGGVPVSGRIIWLNDRPCLIDGVLPRQLDLPMGADIWTPVPFDLNAAANRRSIRSWYGMAHIKHDVSVAAFNSEMDAINRELAREHPIEDIGLRTEATPIREWLTGDVRTSLLILFAAVTGVLLMACANVANLLLARSSSRLREIAVRIAVGASRLKLFQQLITESMLLAVFSSLSGFFITIAVVRILRDSPNLPIPRPESIVVDWRVLVFALLLTGLTGLLFGSLPAMRVSVVSLTSVLSQASGRISDSRRQQAIRKLLVASETAVATVLLIASVLLLRSFHEVSKIDPGFRSDHILTAYLLLPQDRYGKDSLDTAKFAHRVIETLQNTAGIQAAAVSSSVPLQNIDPSGPVQIEGRPMPVHVDDSPSVLSTGVSPTFRKTLGIPLLAGRDLEELDDAGDSSAILVNLAFAKLFFSTQSPVGQRVRSSPELYPAVPWLQIVGVVGDIRQVGLETEVRPAMYIPLSIDTFITDAPAVIIRTADNPTPHLRDIENAVHQADPGVPVFSARSMEQLEARRMGLRTFNTALLTGFGCVALLLAAGGVFAVIAYSVSQRTSEIGVRMAVGATQSNIVAMIAWQGLLPALIGIVAGVLISLFANRYLASLLYGIQTTDAASYAGTILLLTAFSMVAALLPARRAAKVEPLLALRYE